jgi:hypothetical protein
MISPVQQTNTQILGLNAGISNETQESNLNSPGELSDGVLDSIQQNYQGGGTHLDSTIWSNTLNGSRFRPYLDVSIHPYANAIRLPVVANEYDIYADSATFYEDVEIKGSLVASGGMSGSISYDRSIETVTGDKIISLGDKSKILNIEPTGASVTLTLPSTGIPDGFFFEVVNCLEGKFTTLVPDQGQLKAKGTGLSQPYSACHVYRHNSSWYAIGDLTA